MQSYRLFSHSCISWYPNSRISKSGDSAYLYIPYFCRLFAFRSDCISLFFRFCLFSISEILICTASIRALEIQLYISFILQKGETSLSIGLLHLFCKRHLRWTTRNSPWGQCFPLYTEAILLSEIRSPASVNTVPAPVIHVNGSFKIKTEVTTVMTGTM